MIRAGRSRTYLVPRIRRLPGRSATARFNDNDCSALYGTRTRLTCSTGRPPHPHASQGIRVSGGSRTRLSDAAGRCLGCSATDTSKGGRSRTLCACFGGRLRTQEHALVIARRTSKCCSRGNLLALRATVPAAGIEPAAFAFSARRSHRLSYTGIGFRSRRGRQTKAASAGVEPARPRFRASVPCRGPGLMRLFGTRSVTRDRV